MQTLSATYVPSLPHAIADFQAGLVGICRRIAREAAQPGAEPCADRALHLGLLVAPAAQPLTPGHLYKPAQRPLRTDEPRRVDSARRDFRTSK